MTFLDCYPKKKQCGLEDEALRGHVCTVYYGTERGTVRVCAPRAELEGGEHPYPCTERGRVYDGEGRFVGRTNTCPTVTKKDCGEDRCGMPVPKTFSCREEKIAYGSFYKDKSVTLTRCVHPRFAEFEDPQTKREACLGKPSGVRRGYVYGALYDENGEPITRLRCGGMGGGDEQAAAWAGFEADEAEADGADGPPSPDGGDAGAGARPPEPGPAEPGPTDTPPANPLLLSTGATPDEPGPAWIQGGSATAPPATAPPATAPPATASHDVPRPWHTGAAEKPVRLVLGLLHAFREKPVAATPSASPSAARKNADADGGGRAVDPPGIEAGTAAENEPATGPATVTAAPAAVGPASAPDLAPAPAVLAARSVEGYPRVAFDATDGRPAAPASADPERQTDRAASVRPAGGMSLSGTDGGTNAGTDAAADVSKAKVGAGPSEPLQAGDYGSGGRVHGDDVSSRTPRVALWVGVLAVFGTTALTLAARSRYRNTGRGASA